jgi:hypothetical protein
MQLGLYSRVTFYAESGEPAYHWRLARDRSRFGIFTGGAVQGSEQATTTPVGSYAIKPPIAVHQEVDGRSLRPFNIPSGGMCCACLGTVYVGVVSTPEGVSKQGPLRVWKGGEGNSMIFCAASGTPGRGEHDLHNLYFVDENTNRTVMKRTLAHGTTLTCTIMPWAQDMTVLLLGLMMNSLASDGIFLTPIPPKELGNRV